MPLCDTLRKYQYAIPTPCGDNRACPLKNSRILSGLFVRGPKALPLFFSIPKKIDLLTFTALATSAKSLDTFSQHSFYRVLAFVRQPRAESPAPSSLASGLLFLFSRFYDIIVNSVFVQENDFSAIRFCPPNA